SVSCQPTDIHSSYSRRQHPTTSIGFSYHIPSTPSFASLLLIPSTVMSLAQCSYFGQSNLSAQSLIQSSTPNHHINSRLSSCQSFFVGYHSNTLFECLLQSEAEVRRLKQELAQRLQHNNNNHPILHSTHSTPPTASKSAHISSSSLPFNPINSSPNNQSISTSQFSSVFQPILKPISLTVPTPTVIAQPNILPTSIVINNSANIQSTIPSTLPVHIPPINTIQTSLFNNSNDIHSIS
ncbi:unnamed protein product, partial [Rotaria magnacalcarata]